MPKFASYFEPLFMKIRNHAYIYIIYIILYYIYIYILYLSTEFPYIAKLLSGGTGNKYFNIFIFMKKQVSSLFSVLFAI